MAKTNGRDAQEVIDDASERWSDIGRDFNKNANQARGKIAAQLRDLSKRINKEAKNSDMDERFGIQIDRITDQVNSLADYLNDTDVEEMGSRATHMIRTNPWLAVGLAFFAGIWIARSMGGKR